jgi:hypothetical protein
MERTGNGCTRQRVVDGAGANAGILPAQLACSVMCLNRGMVAKTAAASRTRKRGCASASRSAAEVMSAAGEMRPATADPAEMRATTVTTADMTATVAAAATPATAMTASAPSSGIDRA